MEWGGSKSFLFFLVGDRVGAGWVKKFKFFCEGVKGWGGSKKFQIFFWGARSVKKISNYFFCERAQGMGWVKKNIVWGEGSGVGGKSGSKINLVGWLGGVGIQYGVG